MPVSSSDNAMMAKVHCLYGKRLDTGDYDQLLQKRTMPDIVRYLKNETYYSEALAEVNEELVHREQLENLLEQRTLGIYLRLSKYSYGDKLVFKMYQMKSEMEQLLYAMRLLNAGNMSKYIVSLPVYFDRHTPLDLFAVAKARSYDDLLEVVERSEYYDIIGRFRPPTLDKKINIIECETALLTHYYTKLLEMVSAHYHGTARQVLEDILRYQIDFHNISIIYRMKRYFKGTPQSIAKCLVGVKSKLSAKTYAEMLDAPDAASISQVLERRRTYYLNTLDTTVPVDQMFFQIQRIQKKLNQKALRFSIQPVAVVVCYMTLLAIEVNNIINIIEGAKYNLTPEEIRAMLVL